MSKKPLDLDKLSPKQRALLELMLSKKGKATPKKLIPVRDENATLQLSFAQQRLWMVDQFSPGESMYNIAFAIQFKGELNTEAVSKAITEIIRRHESLRTTFSTIDGEPVQVIHDAGEIIPTFRVVLGSTPAAKQEALKKRVEEASVVPFDLESGPLFRTLLLQVEPEDHVLVFTMHHIVSDEWSIRILVQEFTELYKIYAGGLDKKLPELPIQYPDFALWQREKLQGESYNKKIGFWKEKLADVQPFLDEFASFNRPAAQTFNGGIVPFTGLQSQVEKIKSVASQCNVTPFIILMTVYKILLAKYSNRTDITIGTPIVGRDRTEIEKMIGFFANTLVVRSQLDLSKTVRETLTALKDNFLESSSYQEVPFQQIVEAVQPARDPSINPLFQTMFLVETKLEEPQNGQQKDEGLQLSEYRFDLDVAKFDLTFTIGLETSGITGNLSYNTDVFSAEMAEQLVRHYHVLLDNVLSNLDTKLSEINVLSSADRIQVLETWNDTQTDFTETDYDWTTTCVHQIIEKQAVKTPNRIAITYEGDDSSITYASFNAKANQVAHYLNSQGVKQGDLVGVCIDRSINMAIALLGVLKAGAGYVPLDPHYPADRLGYMMEDANVVGLITEKSLESITKGFTKSNFIWMIDAEWDQSADLSTQNPNFTIGSDHLAYVIFTSGSTGRPKGIPIKHRGLTNFLLAMKRAPGINESDKLFCVTTISFDIFKLEFYLPLMFGAEVVLASQTSASDGRQVLKALDKYDISVLQATPATWRMMIDAGWHVTPDLKALCGAEPLPNDLAEGILSRIGSKGQLWNMYGPTEATVWATTQQVTSSKDRITIGKPIANYEIFLLDKSMQPVPIGVPGQLFIGGNVCLSDGYLHQPELSKGIFIDHPFKAGQKVYNSGDLGRYNFLGEIECLGRTDHQVKIRGFRIELGEIETALRLHDDVADVAVRPMPDPAGVKRLVAWIIAEKDTSFDESKLKQFLGQTLPDYMVPSIVVKLDKIPRLPNGKVDNKSLPSPEREIDTATFVAPTTDLEKSVTQIWETVLDVSPIGLKDNFFELGGHSLLAVRLLSEIEKQLGKNIPMASLFSAPILADFVGLLDDQEGVASDDESSSQVSWDSLVPVQPKGTRPPLYCVHGAGGNVLSYLAIAKYLGEDQPVYGLQAQGLDGLKIPYSTVQEMAAHYLEDIYKYQPTGPYMFAGYSAGGTVAYEMARQVNEKGEKVALLVLFDTVNPTFHLKEDQTELNARRRKNVRKRVASPFGIAKWVWNRLVFQGRMFKLWGTRFIVQWHLKRGKPIPQAYRMLYVAEANIGIIGKYIPKKWLGKITLFRAKGGFRVDEERYAQLGWDQISENVHVVPVPGPHHGLTEEPYVGVWAQELETCITDALK